MSKRIMVLNGPNLNLLGTRQPDVYGKETLADIEAVCAKRGAELGLDVDFRQTNSEGEIIDAIQEGSAAHAGLVVNAGAYTHTSVALLDALLACEKPVIEVHLSNIYQRDEFRQHSFVAKAALGSICGLGSHGYELALEALARLLDKS